jgi:hypothetical protein
MKRKAVHTESCLKILNEDTTSDTWAQMGGNAETYPKKIKVSGCGLFCMRFFFVFLSPSRQFLA